MSSTKRLCPKEVWKCIFFRVDPKFVLHIPLEIIFRWQGTPQMSSIYIIYPWDNLSAKDILKVLSIRLHQDMYFQKSFKKCAIYWISSSKRRHRKGLPKSRLFRIDIRNFFILQADPKDISRRLLKCRPSPLDLLSSPVLEEGLSTEFWM